MSCSPLNLAFSITTASEGSSIKKGQNETIFCEIGYVKNKIIDKSIKWIGSIYLRHFFLPIVAAWEFEYRSLGQEVLQLDDFEFVVDVPFIPNWLAIQSIRQRQINNGQYMAEII